MTLQPEKRALPCPFCGKPPFMETVGKDRAGLMIECTTIGCVNPHVSYCAHDTALRVWNMRRANDEQADQP